MCRTYLQILPSPRGDLWCDGIAVDEISADPSDFAALRALCSSEAAASHMLHVLLHAAIGMSPNFNCDFDRIDGRMGSSSMRYSESPGPKGPRATVVPLDLVTGIAFSSAAS